MKTRTVQTLIMGLSLLVILPTASANSANSRTKRIRIVYNSHSAVRLKTHTARPRPKPELRSWELRVAPLPLFFKFLGAEVSYRLSPQFSTGPSAVSYGSSERGSMFTPSFKGYAIGWHADYYFGSVTRDTWYLGTHAFYEKYDSFPHGSEQNWDDVTGVRADVVAGYMWTWSRFHVMTGVGPEFLSQQKVKHEFPGNGPERVTDSTNDFVGVTVELKLTYEL